MGVNAEENGLAQMHISVYPGACPDSLPVCSASKPGGVQSNIDDAPTADGSFFSQTVVRLL